MASTAERTRLAEQNAGKANWRRWGAYLSERAWGTVREDYSAGGDAWNFFPHDHARSRAYRWSEDGIGGFCDDKQLLCLAVALWNGQDPILKERMFGLTNGEGKHGEDVKEYYFFLDGTPTYSYMKMLYKYPQVAYPYKLLVDQNGQRDQQQPEYELIDALRAEFAAGQYFDVVIEYAKAGPEDVLCRITAYNRSSHAAPLHILPHLWYRNTWSWVPGAPRYTIQASGPGAAHTQHPGLEERWWYVRTADGTPLDLMFTENDTNLARLWPPSKNQVPYVKDGINDAVVSGVATAVNAQQGSKAAGHAQAVVPPGGAFTVQVRFTDRQQSDPFAGFDSVFDARRAEADEFYAALAPAGLSADAALVLRQGFAGLLWSKQYYHYDVWRWLMGDRSEPDPPRERWGGRNHTWTHLANADVILMPDTWEYPWYASWDLAFHCVAMARIDPDFAKYQLLLMTREWYQRGDGQAPAYEWNFDDVNPPVLAWAALRVYQIERAATGVGDLPFLEEMFHSLMLNFNWWLNRKDPDGRNIFGGGFLGMDNSGVFDRNRPAGTLSQSDGTSWMGKFCADMLNISLELALRNPVYENMAIKYFEHFLYLAHAMTNMKGAGIHLWNDQDSFFYDVVQLNADMITLRVRSMVGLVPLYALSLLQWHALDQLDTFQKRIQWFLQHRRTLTDLVQLDVADNQHPALIAILNPDRLKAILQRMLDPAEFLSDYGVRALSRYHLAHPYTFPPDGGTITYVPADSRDRLFGGNSNWRGPIWFPVNYLLIRALEDYGAHYGDRLKVECPIGSGHQCTLSEVAQQIAHRLLNIVLRDPGEGGRRGVFGGDAYFNDDPNWRDCIPFYEYFHGDTGAGVGAGHQTGWTALVTSLILDYGAPDGKS